MSSNIALREEIQPRNFGFNLDSVDVMVRSQWQSRSRSSLYLLYRWVVAVFLAAVVGIALNSYVQKSKFGQFFIYYSNWANLLSMAVGVLGAVLVTIWHFENGFKESTLKNGRMPTAFKIYWASHNIALISAFILTIAYWTFLYDDSTENGTVNILTHSMNSVVMFVDILIVAHPLRLYHVIQPMGVWTLYGIFSIIYYLCGGVDSGGKHYIYPIMNWAYPGSALTTILGILILMIIVHAFLFGVYHFRVFVHRKYSAAKIDADESVSNQVNAQ